MLIVDKQKIQSRFIVTVSESTTVANPSYSMEIHSPFTHKTFYLALPANTSPYPERYDEFLLNTSEFFDFEVGTYHYTVREATDGVVEQGVLQVKDASVTQDEGYSVVTPDDIDQFYITYKSNN